ncbi:AzlC family ABC transporter permease [Nereida sp. MMG025]|uniref:AzlC family ABC transporter permease n=1 Tax=Nereida sp. MMG025 TaxID=2909981 RepID=UPI001F2B9469|nr:AzlC family ABC transporter permease [Nereida sp. MMG025]MCF6444371.1 AzlC family ABC transporter permease [Nereida sp. MMG025]
MSTTAKSAFWQGVRDGFPFMLVVAPFGLLFGVVGSEAGLSLLEVMSFSVLVIAGSAQFTAVQLMIEEAPTIIVVLTALAVNLRMAMYSASLAPHLGRAPIWQRAVIAYFMVDQTYALSQTKYDENPSWPISTKVSYFIGAMAPVCPFWYIATLLGAVIGSAIPPEYALDFAIPITFLALVAPALRTLPHVIAAFVSGVMALVFIGLPFSLNIIVAAIIAMLVGAQAEVFLSKRTST